jgi:tRNA 2-thiouridine synthesizing protein A
MLIKISVDARGLSCPMPLLKAKQALNRVAVGEVVEVLASDAASMRDMQAYARMSAHILLLAAEEQGIYRYQIEKR